MHKYYYRKKIFYILLIIAFCAGFPTIVTLLINHGSTGNDTVYTARESGKSITITENGSSQTLDVEEFIPCAMMGQLSVDDNEELLKSFAIIMRTFIYGKLGDKNEIDVSSLDLPYMSYDDMKTTWKDDFADNLNKLNKIMEETSLLVIKYNDTLINPYYHTLSAGVTREGNEEYIKSLDCSSDMEDEKYLQTSVYSFEVFLSTIKEINSEIILSAETPLEAVQIVSRDSAGYITELQIGGTPVDINLFTDKFALASQCFEIDEYNGGIRIITKGIGHGYGMSLHSAKSMGENGKSCTEILNYFYPGTAVTK